MKRKNFAAALIAALCMVTVVGFVPVVSAPAEAESTSYNMFIGTTHFTSDVAATQEAYSFDPATLTLYLHGNITGTYNDNVMSAIQCNGFTGDKLKIVVDGNTTIDSQSTVKGGIFSNCRTYITVNKGCTLTIKGAFGISVQDDLSLTGLGTVRIYTAGNYRGGISSHGGAYYYSDKYNFARHNVYIYNMNLLKVYSKGMYGIYAECGSVYITNSKVYASGYAGGIASVYGNLKITESKKGKFVYASATKGPAVSAVKAAYNMNNTSLSQAKSGARLYFGKKTGIYKPTRSKIRSVTGRKVYTSPSNSSAYMTINCQTIKKGTKVLKAVTIR